MKDNNIGWENPVCNFCKGDKLGILIKDVRYWEHVYSFNVVRCLNCSLSYLSPRPKQEYINLFYKSESYWGSDVRENQVISKNIERERIYGPIYNIISRRKGRILDIGAGTGLFLSKYKDNNWEVDGVEYSRDAVKYAKKSFDLKLKVGDFLNQDFKLNYYDYVVMNNVLEHLYKPFETLRAVNSVLNQNGKLILVVPNIDSLGFKIFKKEWYPLQPPIHLYYFSPKILTKMLVSSGFVVKKYDFSYSLHNNFTMFESFRSVITKRNHKSQSQIKNYKKKFGNSKEKARIKELGNLVINFCSILIAQIGNLLGKGESIIFIAEKK